MTSRSLSIRANGLLHRVLEWPARGVSGNPESPQKTGKIATTVVLLHGLMDAGASWDRCAPYFSELGLRVLAPDLRGFGETEHVKAGGYYHFPDYVLDLASLIRTLVPPDEVFFLVGHSMGGTVATLYTGAAPERVRKLALLEGLGPTDSAPSEAPERMRAFLTDLERHEARTARGGDKLDRGYDSFEEVAHRLALGHPLLPRDVTRRAARYLARRTDDGRWVWNADRLHRTRSPSPFRADQYRAFAQRIECETLVVTGGATGYRTPDHAERVASFRHAREVDIPDAGHMMHWTKPEVVASLLAEFFGFSAGDGSTSRRSP